VVPVPIGVGRVVVEVRDLVVDGAIGHCDDHVVDM
jgi:hypothetical protein